MLGQLPHELRLHIFQLVFSDATFGWILVKITKDGKNVDFELGDDFLHDEFGGAVGCLDAKVVGRKTAAAALEALYGSDFGFAVAADDLPTFFMCPGLADARQPGRLIRGLRVLMDEERGFVGDGKDGQRLRRADWVDLDEDWECNIATRGGRRNRLMRQCWRCLLNMPQLYRVHFYITPVQGKVSKDVIRTWEVRDLLPTVFRLWCRGVNIRVYLRTWEVYQEPKHFLSRWIQRRVALDEHGLHESLVDLEDCIPFAYARWQAPTEEDRVKAAAIYARREHWCLPNYCGRPNSSIYHKVKNFDAIVDLIERLQAKHNYVVIQGDFRDLKKVRPTR